MTRPTMQQGRLCFFGQRGAAVLVILSGVIGGCGSTDDGESSEEDQVSALVTEVCDAAARPETFRALFVDGAAPDDARREQYKKYMYLATKIEIDGDEAAVEVLVEDAGDNAIGTATWTARRKGATWKLSTAPLPGP